MIENGVRFCRGLKPVVATMAFPFRLGAALPRRLQPPAGILPVAGCKRDRKHAVIGEQTRRN